MAKRTGPVKINNYGIDFKVRAVQLSHEPGVLVKDVAESLDIHPFMLSKWRKQVRDGELTGDPPPQPDPVAVAELRRLREVEKQFKRLQMEHDLLKKVIRFASERKAKSSPSLRQTGKPGPSK
jgi:transposase